MTRSERWQYFGIWFFLGFLPLLMRSLWQPDEGRYAEIPREMLASGDWLTPKLNYVLYFEKPPLQYWLSALSMKAFGLNAAAARLPLALASALLLWCAWRLAKRLGADRPMVAAFMSGTALLAYCCGQILTLDALFSAFMVLALTAFIEAVSARYQGRSALGWTLLAFASVALAVLTKGPAAPVLLGGIVICSLPWAWRNTPLRRAVLRTFLDPFGWLLFLVVSVPWFVAVDRANPGHAQFFFVHENFARFTTHVHSRQGSKNPVLDKLYFVLLLLPGLFPWLRVCLGGLKQSVGFLRAKGPRAEDTPLHRWMTVALLMAILVPLVFFSLSGSKLPPYILPVVVPIVSLAVAFARQSKVWSAPMGWELLLLGVAFLIAAFMPRLIEDRQQIEWVFAVAVAFLVLGAWSLRPTGLTRARFAAALGFLCLFLTWTVNHALGASKAQDRLTRQAPAQAQWISMGNYFQILPFISKSPVTVVAGTGELAYGAEHLEPEVRARRFFETPDQLGPAARRMAQDEPQRPVWALVSPDAWKGVPEELKHEWDLVGENPSALLLRYLPMIYLDNNATTRPAPEALEAMLPCYQDCYGNPSSSHLLGIEAEGALVVARERVAALLNASSSEIVFNSGGTEGLNHAFRGVFEAFPKKRHFVSTLVEHSATLALCRWLRRQGAEVTLLGVDPEGRLDLEALEKAIRPDTAMVSIMAANNETGVLFPVQEAAALVKAKGVLFHVDGTQAAGKLPIDLTLLNADLLNISAHKFHGPKGAGALFIRRGLRLSPFMIGGHQERDRRGGTENLPALVGMGRAAELAKAALPEMVRVRELRDRFESRVLSRVTGAHVFGAGVPRLPNTSLIGFEGVHGEAILLRLSERGVCCSTGSACTTGQKEPSHVLQAMEVGPIGRGAVRFSLSRYSTEAEVDQVGDLLPGLVAELRASGGGL